MRSFGSAEAIAAAAKAALAHSGSVKTAALATITHGGYFDVLRAQAAFYSGAYTTPLITVVFTLLGVYGYGLGLVGKFGPAALLAISLGIFVVQVGVSHLWLARFRFGPVEWVWRSLTYGKAQPMRRAAVDTAPRLIGGASR